MIVEQSTLCRDRCFERQTCGCTGRRWKACRRQSLGPFESAPASDDNLLEKFSGRGAQISVCHEAGPTGHGPYQRVRFRSRVPCGRALFDSGALRRAGKDGLVGRDRARPIAARRGVDADLGDPETDLTDERTLGAGFLVATSSPAAGTLKASCAGRPHVTCARPLALADVVVVAMASAKPWVRTGSVPPSGAKQCA